MRHRKMEEILQKEDEREEKYNRYKNCTKLWCEICWMFFYECAAIFQGIKRNNEP